MKKPAGYEFFLETDILAGHLLHNKADEFSDLEMALILGRCFTSVINISELYFAAGSKKQKSEIDNLVYGLTVLGIHSRYGLNISDFFDKVATMRDALICSFVKNNKLPILTDEKNRFNKSGLKIITSKELRGIFDTRKSDWDSMVNKER